MRDHETIQRELDTARERLDRDLSQLRHVVADKVDVKKRAKVAVRHGRNELVDLGRRVRDGAAEHPWTVIAFVLGVTALVTGSIWLARHRERPIRSFVSSRTC